MMFVPIEPAAIDTEVACFAEPDVLPRLPQHRLKQHFFSSLVRYLFIHVTNPKSPDMP